ncbi:MAG: hypothetical protein NXI32_11360 [bacterium]|nr:hypothetical protein [bacterium]
MAEDRGFSPASFGQLPQQYHIHFVGGPLDGASVITDERPNCDTFVHRALGRCYLYRYETSDHCSFRAIHDSGDLRASPQLVGRGQGLASWLLLVFLLFLLFVSIWTFRTSAAKLTLMWLTATGVDRPLA